MRGRGEREGGERGREGKGKRVYSLKLHSVEFIFLLCEIREVGGGILDTYVALKKNSTLSSNRGSSHQEYPFLFLLLRTRTRLFLPLLPRGQG